MKSRTLTCITAVALFAALAIPVGLAAQEQEQGQPLSVPIFTTLADFNGTNGASPGIMSLVQGGNGHFYGTTYSGGANDFGTVFEITPGGVLSTLHSFDSTEAANPNAALLLATNGNFYGTTYQGNGTAFEITPGGTLSTVHSFDNTDGARLYAALIQGTDGNFYGTSFSGGADFAGTVFEMTPAGTVTTLHSFCSQPDCNDGVGPSGALIQASNGNFYGTTYYGGADESTCNFGSCGTVFEITPEGVLTTLHSFEGTDGARPQAGLVQANDGNFYGTTQGFGANGDGTVFKITPEGVLTTLLSFDGTDGEGPQGSLIQATDGNFYGTTPYGGAYGFGTMFEITPGGTLTTLHSFDSTDGSYPFGGLFQATNGTLYGTTSSGGAHGDGTVFSLNVGLRPFVETLPTAGEVGSTVNILGTGLKGATSVTFNGTAAAFTVVSSSLIRTTVPAGATTGNVSVVRLASAGETLTSNVPFQVTP